jgi:hypothetical protein
MGSADELAQATSGPQPPINTFPELSAKSTPVFSVRSPLMIRPHVVAHNGETVKTNKSEAASTGPKWCFGMFWSRTNVGDLRGPEWGPCHA